MKKLIGLGVSVVLCAELAALSLHDRRFVLWAAGAAVLFALVNVRQVLGRSIEPPPPEVPIPPATAEKPGREVPRPLPRPATARRPTPHPRPAQP